MSGEFLSLHLDMSDVEDEILDVVDILDVVSVKDIRSSSHKISKLSLQLIIVVASSQQNSVQLFCSRNEMLEV